MDRIDLSKIYDLGQALKSLSDLARDGVTLSSILMPMFNAQNSLKWIRSNDRPNGLVLSLEAARAIVDPLDALETKYFKDQQGSFIFPKDPNAQIPAWEISAIVYAITRFETIFKAEMQNAATYSVPKLGIYDIGDLVDRASNAFSLDIRSAMNTVTIDEYTAAGRCYAFGLFTASGYHSCRAVESVLIEYYRIFTGKQENGKETWGQLVDALEKAQPTPDKKTIGHIRHIKDFDRNPLSHLRANLNADDVDVLLADAKIAITAMIREIKANTQATQPSLALVHNTQSN
jgi:hypothetical protein